MLKDPIDHAGNDLKLWVDASKLSQVPDLWVDKSGSGNDLNKSDGSIELVLYAQNGLNVLRTDNFKDEFYSRSISNLSAGDQTWMILYRPRSENATDSGHDGILGYEWDNGHWDFESGSQGVFNGRIRWRDEENSVWKFTSNQMSPSNQWNLYSVSFHEASNSYNVRLWQNGTLHSTNTSGEDLLEDNGTINIMRANATSPTSAIGDYAEVLIFSSVDTTITQKMEGYLMHKWGLAGNLPSAHNYKSFAPTTTSWSDVQSFTTPTVTTAPTLGSQSAANVDTTSADMQVVLMDNGNAATTVVFYWGDNDGGTNPASWDSNITLTNSTEGINLRASLTGLISSNTYYFRTWATNTANKGDDWANSTSAFTTLTSLVREDRDIIAHSDLVGWWKLDGDTLDSSGNQYDGNLSGQLSAFTDSTPFDFGKSLDLSNGSYMEVSSGGTEDIFDGESNFSVSMWMKGWPSENGQSLISKNTFDPGSFGEIKAWLDATDPKFFSKDDSGNSPANGEGFVKWYDLSGNQHHASIDSGSPTWDSIGINNKPAANLSNAAITLDNSAEAFDAWSQLHVFAVFKITTNTSWKRIFGKTSNPSSAASTAWTFFVRRGDFNPPIYAAHFRNNSETAFIAQVKIPTLPL